MTTVVAWLVFPAVLYLITTAIGLLARVLARAELPDALLAPSGACLSAVVVLVVLELGGSGRLAAGVLVALAFAGFVAGHYRLPGALAPGWPAVAALTGFALYMGPVVLTGHWTWLGYNFVNDTASNLAVTRHLAVHGKELETGLPSTYAIIINGTLTQGYPLGAHGLLAALGSLVPAPFEAVYQPFIACLAGLGAMALTWLARAVGVAAPAAAAAGALAVGANLAYQYALQGSFKEIMLVTVVLTAAAPGRIALDQALRVGTVVLTGACLAAGIGVFTAGAAGYAAALAAAALATVAIERPRLRVGVLGRAAVVGAVALVLPVGPALADALGFARKGLTVFANTNADLGAPLSSPAVLGQLARPLPIDQALGTWIRGDYRYPLAGLAATSTAIVLFVAGALIVVVLVTELRRRRIGALLALVPALAVYLVARPRLEPYADAKLLVILSPPAVFAAALGAWWLYRRASAAGIAAAAVLVGGVLVSDAMAYRFAHVAPTHRLEQLKDAAERAAGRGPWLFPEWEEYAKDFGSAAALNVASESFSPRPVRLRRNQPIFNRSFDLDDMALDYVESWPGIMLRRSPEASRPPANYDRTYANEYYELWERRASSPTVLEHLPLQLPGQAAALPRCGHVRALASRARPSDRLVAARRAQLPMLGVRYPLTLGMTAAKRLPAWPPSGETPNVLIPNGQGVIGGRLRVPAGTYWVWVRGGGGRPLAISVDGRKTGAPRQINTPGQWLPAGRATLSDGPHDIELERPGGGLEPGNDVEGVVGAVALERAASRPLVSVAPRHADRLCGRRWDWIELVAG